MGTTHTVARGESLSSIARRYGCRSWRDIYEAPQNLEFRRQRPNPDLIHEGDVIYIPAQSEVSRPAETGALSTYIAGASTDLPRSVEFCFVSAENPALPLQGIEVEVEVNGGRETLRKISDGVGRIHLTDLEGDSVRLVQIRYPALGEVGIWDEQGGVFEVGQTYPIELANTFVEFNGRKPLAYSARRPGLDESGNQANDMKSGGYTKKQIQDINILFVEELYLLDERSLFLRLRLMATSLFATGELEENIKRMIDHFEASSGEEYSDPVLTQAVKNHPSTGRFIDNIKEELHRLLRLNGGDAERIALNEMTLKGRPHFSGGSDIRTGLTIAVNDTHAYDVMLTRFRRVLDRYEATIDLTLYDHFGLDEPDVEKKYVYLAGFRAWFVLQHLKKYGYKPFVTKMEFSFGVQDRMGRRAGS